MTTKSLKRFSYSVLVGPTMLVYSLVVIFPVVVSIFLGFHQWSGFGPWKFVGLANYAQMIKQVIFWVSLRNNLWIIAVSLFGQIPLGFIFAYFIYRRLVRGGKFFEVMIFLPIVISQVVIAILWNRIVSPVGMITSLISTITGNPDYHFLVMQNINLAIFPILFVILWEYTGLYLIIFLSNLQKIPVSTIEAAVIDGATEGQVLWRIIVPAMVNVLFTTTVLAISGSLTSFTLIYSWTAGGPANYTDILALYMYQSTFDYHQYGFGSALSTVIVVLSIVLISGTRAIANIFERKFT